MAKVEQWKLQLVSERTHDKLQTDERPDVPPPTWESDSDSDESSCRGRDDDGTPCQCCRGSGDDDAVVVETAFDDDDDDDVGDTDASWINFDTVHFYVARVASTIASFAEDSLFLASVPAADMEAAFPVVWDTGASVCVTHCKEDFVGPLRPPPPTPTNGVDGPVQVAGSGQVSWTFRTTDNTFRTVMLPGVYIPTSK